MAGKSLKEHSRIDYTIEGSVTPEWVVAGCLQRIASSCEIMSKDRLEMERQLKYYRDRHQEQIKTIAYLTKSRDSYKGKFNHLKNKNQ